MWTCFTNLTSSMSPRGNRRTSKAVVLEAQWANSMANRAGFSESPQTGWRIFQKPWLLLLGSKFRIWMNSFFGKSTPKFNTGPEIFWVSKRNLLFQGMIFRWTIIAKGQLWCVNLVDCRVVTKRSPYATSECLALLAYIQQIIIELWKIWQGYWFQWVHRHLDSFIIIIGSCCWCSCSNSQMVMYMKL